MSLLKKIYNWFFPPPVTTVRELVSVWKQLDSISRYVKFHISYKKNPNWVTSEEVLKIQQADCKGFAVLFYDILTLLGYKPAIWGCMHFSESGHAIVIFESKNGWCYISNGTVVCCEPTIKTDHDCVMTAMPKAGMYKEVDVTGKVISIL